MGNALLRLGLTFVLAIVALFLFGQLAFGVAYGLTTRFDEAVMAYVSTHQPDWLRVPTLAVTRLADGATIAIVSTIAAIWLWLRHRNLSAPFNLYFTVVGGYLLIESIKLIFARPRPDGPFTSIEAIGHSFPSGHSFFSLTLYGYLAYQLAREAPLRLRRLVWTAVIVLALFVGSSRVILSVHYPTDVAAGFATAIFWLWGCLHLPRHLRANTWREWKESRMRRLGQAREILLAVEDKRAALYQLTDELLKDPTLGWWRRAELQIARVLASIARYVARLISEHPYAADTVILAVFIRRSAGPERLGESLVAPIDRLSWAGKVFLGIEGAEEFGGLVPKQAIVDLDSASPRRMTAS